MFPFFFFDPSMVLLIPGIILAGWAQLKVKSTFKKYSEYDARCGLTAAQIAQDILSKGGLSGSVNHNPINRNALNVQIGHVSGNMTDHYDPRDQALNLSDTVHSSRSLAAIGVAAHEAGHAFQHAQAYAPLQIRASLVPVANFGSMLAFPLVIGGIFLNTPFLAEIGVVLFSFAVLFGLVTLPVEFNASRRAIAILKDGGYLTAEELPAAKKVLDAAAWTYVASALMAVLSLVRLLIISGLLGGRDD
jgi:Zn-dependent membrane protease YugP